MSSILRSSKFVRYLAGFAKNVVVNTPREFDGNLVNTASTHCLCGAFPRSFASQTSAHHDQNLEIRLKSLDQDVRKSGRISRRDIEDILEEIRITRSATSSQSLLVIRCCGTLVPEELPEVRTKLVQEIWQTLNKLNVPMDVSHYNALLRVYLENEYPFSPTEFLSNMESKGIEPNRVTYQRLISRYCQDGDIEGATRILEFMREKQMPVNENVFNALIVGHSQAGDMDSAQGILSVMAQAGLEASADTYTTLLCGYAKTGNLDKIMQIMEECEAKEVYLLDKDYLDIIYALATSGYADKIQMILTRVRKSVGYNQDAINMILRLINKNQEETAFEIMKTMVRSTRPDGSTMPIGTFFIRQLVKADKPLDKIIQYCSRLDQEGMYDRGTVYAAEASLELGNEKLAYQLFKEMQKTGHEIRQHYFWPLLRAKAKDRSGKEIVRVLQKMQEFDITPNSETLREYVLPYIKGNSADILATLREANISMGSSASSLVVILLQKENIKEAATIASSVDAYYHPEIFKKPLTRAFYSTNDLESYATILRAVHDNVDRRTSVSQHLNEVNQTEVVGSFLIDLMNNTNQFLNVVVPVLTRVVQEGLTISTASAQIIENKLGEKMTEQISDLLGKLTSGELTPVERAKKSPAYVPSERMNSLQLETLIRNLDAKGGDTKGLKRRLWTLHYYDKNIEKLEKMFEELKNTDYVITTGMYAQLMDSYAHHENLDKALEYFNFIKNEGFKLDESKMIRLAHLLTKNDRFEEAVKLLEEIQRVTTEEGSSSYVYVSQVWRFLNSLAEEGRVDDVNRVFNLLHEKQVIDVNATLLGPLIKVHMVRKELDKALEKFEWCVSKFRCTPWKNELACQLIQIEDAERLQKLTDLSTLVHGEINSLYDLVFSFVECGRTRQARKILETPGMQSRPHRINSACERFSAEGLVKPLEDLRDATKDLNHIDRSDIYHQLLLTYIKQDDPEKCLGLWTQMQEEDLAPSDEFLIKLAKYLEKKQIKVPFVVPQSQIVEKQPGVSLKNEVSPDKNVFRRNLKSGNLDACMKMLETSKENFSVGDLSLLMEKLVQNDRLAEATNLAVAMLKNSMSPAQKHFKFLLNKLAIAGDVEALNVLSSEISSNLKKIVSFDNKVCQAHLVSGNGEKYLQHLEDVIDNAKDENLQNIAESFPRGGACGILERYPEWTDKYEHMAFKYAKKGILGPLNVLWSHYFINHEFTKADQLWREYLKDANRIMFQRIVQAARDRKDIELVRHLIDHLKISKVTEGAIGNAYSCLLDVLVAEEKHDDVVDTFQKAVEDVKIEFLNRTAVLRVKTIFEKLGKEFSHEVPPKKHNSSPKKDTEEIY